MDFALIWSLVVALYGVVLKAAPIQKEITAREGDNVTLVNEVVSDIGFLYDDNNTALFDLGNKSGSESDKRIHWDMKTRSIILLNVQKEDSKTYHLQFFLNGSKKTVTIRLNVTERLHQDPEDPSPGPTPESITAQQGQRSRLALCVSLGLIATVVSAFSLIICWKKRTPVPSAFPPLQVTQRSTEALYHCCTNDTGAGSSGSTSRSDSLEEPEMEVKLMSSKEILNG